MMDKDLGQDRFHGAGGTFTLNQINEALYEFVIEELLGSQAEEMTDEQIQEFYDQYIIPELLFIMPMGETQNVTALYLPGEIFWDVVGKNLMGQYGINGETLMLVDPDNVITSSDETEFTEWYMGSTNNSNNVFAMMEIDDRRRYNVNAC